MSGKLYTRRDFLKLASITAVSGLALSSVSCTKEEREEWMQKRFLEMSEDEKKRVIKRLENKYLRKYDKKFDISVQSARPNTLWGYGLDLSRCIGCRRCVYACVQENNQSRHNPQLQWIRVLRLKRGSLINLENSEHYYQPGTRSRTGVHIHAGPVPAL